MDGAWQSLLPPLVAILLALTIRRVVFSLMFGVWIGSLVLANYAPLQASLDMVQVYMVGAVADEDHASILIFSLLLGGMIGVMSRSGGSAGLAILFTRRATTRTRGQLATWAMGLVLFFDDYANALLVGSSMRPITDRLRISREKLAFLVDATAAPVASIALVSSWIGVEVAYIGEQISALGLPGDPYVLFLESLVYRFYPWLMLFFVLSLILLRRDFGPMLAAERRALLETPDQEDAPPSGAEESAGAREPRWWIAAIPVLAVVVVAMLGMVLDGRAKALEAGIEPSLRNILGNANSIGALLVAAFVGNLLAISLARVSSAGTRREISEAWLEGMRSMVLACVVLVLAWSLGSLCRELHTAEYLIGALGSWLVPGLVPATVFVVAAAVSFATGTSWGTMAILFPLVVPLAHGLAPGDADILLGAISSILAGAVWGDHCSPISDTTIMSAMASGCDQLEHVRTQLPYALLVGLVSVVVGELGTGFGLYPPWAAMILGALTLLLIIRFVGRPVEASTSTSTLGS